MESQMCLGNHLRDCVLCCLVFEEKVFGIRATHNARVEWAARDGWFTCGQIFAFLSISFLLCKWF